MVKHLYILAAALISVSAWAGCDNLYPNGKKITVPNTTELCNSVYVSVFDEKKNAVVFVSEYLKESTSFGEVPRINSFRPDPRLKHSPAPGDYALSGYDKGHLSAAEDAATPDELRTTFYMSNMTPQNPTLNRGSWKMLEMKVRKMVLVGPLWSLTVPTYAEPSKMLKTIPIPTGYWKIIYQGGKPRYFYADNIETGKVVEKFDVDISKIIQ